MERPKSVKIVIIAALIGMIINIIDVALYWKGATKGYGHLEMNKVFITFFILSILYLTILYFFFNRKKWARITLIIVIIPLMFTHIAPIFLSQLYVQITQGLQLITSLTCVIYLFSSSTKNWFNHKEIV